MSGFSGHFSLIICISRISCLLLHVIWPGSLVNRASDSGSEGRGFDSHPGHTRKSLIVNEIIEDFFFLGAD